jgi:hypothetical protein
MAGPLSRAVIVEGGVLVPTSGAVQSAEILDRIRDADDPVVLARRVPRAVARGLSTLTCHAEAGGPDDLEIDTTTAEGREMYREVERAIAWVKANL